jgi:DNA-binding transcriptional LysR family regulator
MELRHLRYFQAVAEELSFSRAARRLSIAQPALSRAVQELEQSLDLQLFDRNRRTVRLTAAGSVMLQEVSSIFEQLEISVRRVRRTAAGEEGELRLGYIGPPTQAFLGRLLGEFRARYPLVSVRLEERTPERVWEMVASGRLSMGLTRPVPGQGAKALNTLLLRNEPLCVAVPVGHAWEKKKSVDWKALAGEPMIVLARREGVGSHDEILVACRDAGFAPKLVHTPSLIGTVLSYVEAGAGIGVVPDSIRPMTPGAVTLVPLKPLRTVPLVLVWHPEADTPAAAAFRGLIQDWMKSGELWRAL